MKPDLFLGFPDPLLGDRPVRLPVLFDDGEVLVFAKPCGVLVETDSWYPRLPVLVEAIRYQAGQGKPEFSRIGIPPEGLRAVTGLDPDCHGPVLFARGADQAEALRNACGSNQFRFRFVFLTAGNPTRDAIQCDLPISRHTHQRKMLISHATGKKAATSFERTGRVGAFHLWTARTSYVRHHQILLHAFEAGLPVLGDALYARSRPPMLSSFKRQYTGKRDQEERPLFEGPAYYLQELQLPSGVTIPCPEPPRWGGLLRQLVKHSLPADG
ncbi:MAG: hypothetical protein ACP5I4_00080 [Oceanipulchritudo sp.]